MGSRSVPDPVVVCAEVLGRFGVAAADVAGAGESPEDAIGTALDRAPSRAAFLRRTISTAPRGIDAPARYARETPWAELRTAFEALGWSLAVEDRSGRPVGGVASPAGPFSVTVEDAEGRARTATVEYPATPLGRYNLPAILARVEDGVLYGLDWTFVALSDGADRWRFAPVRREDLETLQAAHGPRVTPFERPVLARHGPEAYDPPAADDVWPAWTDDVDADAPGADVETAGDDATAAADDVITFVGDEADDRTGDADDAASVTGGSAEAGTDLPGAAAQTGDDGVMTDADPTDDSVRADADTADDGGATAVADVTFDGLSDWSTADDGAESDDEDESGVGDEDESATEGDARVESVTAAGGSIGSTTTLGSGSAEGTTEAVATEPGTASPGSAGGASASAATPEGGSETDGLTLSGSPTTRTVGEGGDDESGTTAADPTDGDADDDGAFFDSGLSGGPSVDRVENESFGLPESQTEDERLQAAGAAIDAGGGVSVEGLLDDESFLPTIPTEGPTEVTLSFEDSFDPSAPSPAETREADSEDGFVWVNADGLE